MGERRFTREEAEALLPEVRVLVERLARHERAAAAIRSRRNELALRVAGNGGGLDDPAGLVDFPTLVDGEEAYLCWRLGEERIEHWHGLEEGFAGRKALDP
jgi:hypothetical protein